jgi:hypothetical protein
MITHPLQTKTGLISGLLDWLVNNSLTVTIIVLVLLAFLMLVVALYLFRRSRQPSSFSRNFLTRTSRRTKKAAKKKGISGWTLVDVTGQRIPLKPLPFNIGRESGNSLVLDDLSVSAQHARIIYDPTFGGLVIEDLNSPSGILVEGQPTRKNLLQSGMQLTVGRYTFTLNHQSS